MKIGMIGLGKLGLPCAEVMAQKHEVSGFDVQAVSAQGVRIVPSIAEVVRDQDIVFIAVPTPHDSQYDGRTPIANLPPKDFDYSIVQETLAEVGRHTKPGQDVVLISTVLPGTMRREFAPLITNYNLIYNPYFIAMGTVKEDFLNPEFMSVGTIDGSEEKAAALLAFYSGLIADLKYSLGTWEESEAVKIFYNTFISFKLSYVNMIMDVADRIGHMNVDVVTQALSRADYRLLSPTYMKAGMGDGGPCHPRDNIALRYLATSQNLNYDLFHAIMTTRERQAENLARTLVSFNKDVVILGKSFKPGVPLVDGSYSLLVGHYVENFGTKVGYVDSLLNCNDDTTDIAKTYLLGHMGDEWHSYSFRAGSVIVDPWRSGLKISGCEVIPYGNTRG